MTTNESFLLGGLKGLLKKGWTTESIMNIVKANSHLSEEFRKEIEEAITKAKKEK